MLAAPANRVRLDAIEQLANVADDPGLTMIQLALRFVTAHSAVTIALLGPRTLAHLQTPCCPPTSSTRSTPSSLPASTSPRTRSSTRHPRCSTPRCDAADRSRVLSLGSDQRSPLGERVGVAARAELSDAADDADVPTSTGGSGGPLGGRLDWSSRMADGGLAEGIDPGRAPLRGQTRRAANRMISTPLLAPPTGFEPVSPP
jgi:Aldo/keto reductase family